MNHFLANFEYDDNSENLSENAVEYCPYCGKPITSIENHLSCEPLQVLKRLSSMYKDNPWLVRIMLTRLAHPEYILDEIAEKLNTDKQNVIDVIDTVETIAHLTPKIGLLLKTKNRISSVKMLERRNARLTRFEEYQFKNYDDVDTSLDLDLDLEDDTDADTDTDNDNDKIKVSHQAITHNHLRTCIKCGAEKSINDFNQYPNSHWSYDIGKPKTCLVCKNDPATQLENKAQSKIERDAMALQLRLTRKENKKQNREADIAYVREAFKMHPEYYFKGCTHCHIDKPLIDFVIDNASDYGFKGICKACDASIKRQKRIDTKDVRDIKSQDVKAQKETERCLLKADMVAHPEKYSKKCAICGAEKCFTDFVKDNSTKTGRNSYCKPCFADKCRKKK